MHCIRRVQIGFAFLLMIGVPAAHAAIFCVNTSADIQSALTTAASNGEHDIIRIRVGTYARVSAVAFSYATSENFDLTIEGGWEPFLMFNCGRRIDDPRVTGLSGSDARQVLGVFASGGSSGAIAIENLTLRDGLITNADRGAGLEISGSGNSGDVRVERVYFSGNVSGNFAGGASITTAGRIYLRNNWFRSNRCADNYCAALIFNTVANGNEVRGFISNNTVVNNTCSNGPLSCATAGIGITGTVRASVFNNLFYLNQEGNDLGFTSSNADVEVLHNNIRLISGTPTSSVGNINTGNPQFVNAALGDYRLEYSSILRDAGIVRYTLGGQDFNGLPRINGDRVDIGAFENDEILFKHSFEFVPPPQ